MWVLVRAAFFADWLRDELLRLLAACFANFESAACEAAARPFFLRAFSTARERLDDGFFFVPECPISRSRSAFLCI